MSRNLTEIYKDQDEIISAAKAGMGNNDTLFDSVELGAPVVVSDDLARQWIESHYLFCTHFSPGGLPGVGELGGDLSTSFGKLGKVLTSKLYLMDFIQRAMRDFRKVEPVAQEWIDVSHTYKDDVLSLVETVDTLVKTHPELDKFKNLREDAAGFVGWQYVGLPSERFVKHLEELSALLPTLSDGNELQKASELAQRLSKDLSKYSSAVSELAKIRKYGKRVPRIEGDMIRIPSPGYSGGLCWHSHPGHEDNIHALPSGNDLALLAAQSGSIPVMHIGAGETQGEEYTIHVPKTYFFDEVREKVDSESADTGRIMQIKQDVLAARLDDIMADDILGFKASGKEKHRTLTLHPLVSASVYAKHASSLKQKGTDFPTQQLLIDAGQGGAFYHKMHDALIEIISTHGVFLDLEESE